MNRMLISQIILKKYLFLVSVKQNFYNFVIFYAETKVILKKKLKLGKFFELY